MTSISRQNPLQNPSQKLTKSAQEKSITAADDATVEPVLNVQQLRHSVQSGDQQLTILNGISFELSAAETLAIVGTSGSGKSTLLGLLAGLDQATSGEIILLGSSLSDLNEDQRAQVRAQGVGFVFQNFQLLNGFTALENVMLPLDIAAQSPAQAKQEAQHLLHQVGLAQRAHHYPSQLSGGEQQRVALARAFASRPRILFADEPTGNLDPHTGAAIIDLMFELNRTFDTTLVLVTHDSQLAQRCQRTLTMHEGVLHEEG